MQKPEMRIYTRLQRLFIEDRKEGIYHPTFSNYLVFAEFEELVDIQHQNESLSPNFYQVSSEHGIKSCVWIFETSLINSSSLQFFTADAIRHMLIPSLAVATHQLSGQLKIHISTQAA